MRWAFESSATNHVLMQASQTSHYDAAYYDAAQDDRRTDRRKNP